MIPWCSLGLSKTWCSTLLSVFSFLQKWYRKSRRCTKNCDCTCGISTWEGEKITVSCWKLRMIWGQKHKQHQRESVGLGGKCCLEPFCIKGMRTWKMEVGAEFDLWPAASSIYWCRYCWLMLFKFFVSAQLHPPQGCEWHKTEKLRSWRLELPLEEPWQAAERGQQKLWEARQGILQTSACGLG